MRRRRLLTLILGLSVLAACEDTSRPVDPVWGKTSCRHCRMVVSDPRFAAQAVNDAGERMYFDDPGCLVEHLAEARAARSWVRDEHGVWIDTARARFASGATTPMDYGFVPARSGALDFAALRRAVAARREEQRR